MVGSPRFGCDSFRVWACFALTILFAICRMDIAIAEVAGIAAIPGGGNVPGGGRRAGGMSCADVEDGSMQCGLYEGLPQFNCPEACQGQWKLYNETEWLLSQEEPCTQIEQYFLQLDRCSVDAASDLGNAATRHTILALSISIILALMGNVFG